MPQPPNPIRHRRAVGLMAMSALLPGSAQYVAGHRRLGLWSIRLWIGLVSVVVVLAVGFLVARGYTMSVLLWGPTIGFMRVAVWLIFGWWLVLLLDAWRLTKPPTLSRGFRLGMTAATLVLAVIAGMITNLVASAFVAAGNVAEVFEGGGEAQPQQGRYNILLLGVDAAADREGIRPDSINVASIDADTGRVVIFGLPRNLMGAPFPESSPLYSQYPSGYSCGGECMLNGVYTLGVDNAVLYPGQDPGIAAMKEAVSATLGLELNYYAMIDLAGFQSLVDAMGGIRLNINKRVPIGGGSSTISEWIEPGENVQLDGYQALWFARSRADSDDYERMIRQKCVMSAMVKQLDLSTLATRFVQLSEAGSDVVSTDVGTDKITELVGLALQGKDLPIETVNFSPPLIETGNPDFALIRKTVSEAIAASEALDDPSTSVSQQPSPSATSRVPSAATSRAPQSTAAPENTQPATPAATATESEPSTAEPICSVP